MEIGICIRNVNLAYCFAEFRKPGPFSYAPGKLVFGKRNLTENVLQYPPEDACGDLAGRFVNGDDAPHVQALGVLIARKNLEFGLNHHSLTARPVQFDFAEQSNTCVWHQAVGIAFAMKPAGAQLAGSVRKTYLEQARSTVSKAGQFGVGHNRDNGCLFARNELSDGLDVAPIFIAKRRVIQQIRDGEQAF